MNELREELAEYAHTAWSGWMEYLFKQCIIKENGEVIIPQWAVERWNRQMNTSYEDLTEKEKDSDRKEADKMLTIFINHD